MRVVIDRQSGRTWGIPNQAPSFRYKTRAPHVWGIHSNRDKECNPNEICLWRSWPLHWSHSLPMMLWLKLAWKRSKIGNKEKLLHDRSCEFSTQNHLEKWTFSIRWLESWCCPWLQFCEVWLVLIKRWTKQREKYYPPIFHNKIFWEKLKISYSSPGFSLGLFLVIIDWLVQNRKIENIGLDNSFFHALHFRGRRQPLCCVGDRECKWVKFDSHKWSTSVAFT